MSAMPEERDVPAFERTLPHDIAAEQCVLGGMLLSREAIADVVEVIGPLDHYRPAHQIVHETVLELYGRGKPADAVTVAAELVKQGKITKVGGHTYLADLIRKVPTAANAGYYARIVLDNAILRRLCEVGTRMVQRGYSADGDPAGLVDQSEAEVLGILGGRGEEECLPLSQVVPGTLDDLEAIGKTSGITGVPTGFADLDAVTSGLQPGQMVTIAARPAIGKALALDTPLPTPAGWTTMGEVQVGDYLIGADGKPTCVLAVTDVMHERPCFEVEFNDGTAIVADAEHQWRTTTRASRRQRSENHTTWYWPEASRKRLQAACAAALEEPDRHVTAAEVIATVGTELRNTLRLAGREIGYAPDRLPVEAEGPQRRYAWHAPAYSSRHALLLALTQRAGQPKNAATTTRHQDIVTTAQIAASVRAADGRKNHAVGVAQPATLPTRELPLPPYTLGAWLGDGTSDCAQITTADPELVAEIEADGFRVVKSRAANLRYSIRLPALPPITERQCAVCQKMFIPQTSQVRTCGKVCGGRSRSDKWRAILGPAPEPQCPDCDQPSGGGRLCRACRDHHGSVQAVLRSMGMLDNKHIPAAYLRASEPQRRALLAGLLDTDGYVNKDGTVQFSVTSQRLAADTLELILSLGYRAAMTTKRVKGHTPESSTCYTVTFTPAEKVFRLTRKAVRQTTRNYPTTRCRFITAVRSVASVPVRCVQVDNPDQMYLASRSWIPTHNSTLALDWARWASIHKGLTSVIFSLEMSRSEITTRLLSAESRVPLHNMRTGQMTPGDWAKVQKYLPDVLDAPMFIDDSPGLNVTQIRAKCRRLKQRHGLRLVIIDYLQLMSSPGRPENRQAEVSEMSRSLKLLAKELGVPVVAVAQLNRGPELRTDKKPLLADLRECLTGDTVLVDPVTGMRSTIAEAHASGEPPRILSLDDRWRLRVAQASAVIASGVKPVYRLRTSGGRGIRASANHPFRMLDGWRQLGDLRLGDEIAVPRRYPGVAATEGGDVRWERVTSIEPAGEEMTYDLVVPGHHNFVANDIVVHNSGSIENDSDVVILIHREDAYKPESPRAGEADFIIAKHRNGPTCTVTVAFQGHYSRFVDMAPA